MTTPAIIPIQSVDDPRVAHFRDVRDKDLRGHDRLFMAESEMVVRRLLKTPERLHSLLMSPQKFERLQPDLEPLAGHAEVYIADVDLMATIAGFHIHRGVLAAGRRPHPAQLDLGPALGRLKTQTTLTVLIAEGLTNVDNMGGLFRNAAAFGADGVALDPTSCDPLYRKAIRVSMGHVLSTPWAVCRDWPADLLRLKDEWGLTLVGAETVPEAQPLWTLPTYDRVGIVFGSEADGLSDDALAACDRICCVPMAPDVPSLNVATASAVFLYQHMIRRELRAVRDA